jgi:hypothetical protein
MVVIRSAGRLRSRIGFVLVFRVHVVGRGVETALVE